MLNLELTPRKRDWIAMKNTGTSLRMDLTPFYFQIGASKAIREDEAWRRKKIKGGN